MALSDTAVRSAKPADRRWSSYLPLTAHRSYRETLGWCDEQMPVAYKFGQQILSPPLYPAMDDAKVERSGSAVTQIFD